MRSRSASFKDFKDLIYEIKSEIQISKDKTIKEVKEFNKTAKMKLEQKYRKIQQKLKEELKYDERIDSIKELNEKSKKLLKEKYLKMQQKIYTEKFMRQRDKYGFVFGVVNLVVTAFLIGYNPLYYIKYYSFKYPILWLIRVIRYWYKNWYLYCLDFCYYTNFLTLYFLYFGQNNMTYFNMIFMFNFGPLIWGIPMFRNSLVLHSLDRITSICLHFAAPVVCYVIKWMDYQDIFQQNHNLHLDLFQYYYVGTIGYLIWMLFYYICVFVILPKEKLKKLDSCYSLVLEDKNKKNFCHMFGEKFSGILYMMLHLLWFLVCGILSFFMFEYQLFNLIVLVFVFLCSVWNGANYYMEWFSKKYEKHLWKLNEDNPSLNQYSNNQKNL